MGDYGILAGLYKGFDLEVLLDLLEEQHDQPALFIDNGSQLGAEGELIDEKQISFTGFRVAITDTTQVNRTFPSCLCASELDGVTTARILLV